LFWVWLAHKAAGPDNAWHSVLGIAPVLLAVAVAGVVAADTYSGFRSRLFQKLASKRVLAVGSALAPVLASRPGRDLGPGPYHQWHLLGAVVSC
jgi:hypothetical protein